MYGKEKIVPDKTNRSNGKKPRQALAADSPFNIGINDGPAAGQTVAHAHVHIIPRYLHDVPDPRGGIRWILAAKARYW
jgi:diadenosine tetraphosphate (Ap4A) HIT family hydrolase